MFFYVLTSLALVPLLVISFFLYLNAKEYANRFLYKRRAKRHGCEDLPRRPSAYVLGIGNIMRIIKADQDHKVPNFFEHLQQEIGVPTWKQWIMGDMQLWTTEPRNIQALLATQFKEFELGPTRRNNFFPMLGNGIFTSDGRVWEHSRALLRPQFARDQVGDLELEEKHIQDMFKHLQTDHTGWTSQVNLQPLFFRLTLDSATEFLFGESVHAQLSSLPVNEEKSQHFSNRVGLDLSEVAAAFDRSTHNLGKRARFGDQYWLYNPAQFSKDNALVHQFADYYVDLALKTDMIEYEKRGKYVFLIELVKATRDPIELRSQLLNILLAGRDTTAGLLGWSFFLFARHPDVLTKLRQTIVETFGTYDNPRNITFATLKSCSYLQHVMNETLRLFPMVPMNSRRAIRDTTLPIGGGADGKSSVFVPAGTQVDYSVHVMHRRKDLWGEDALEFKPERWQGRKVGWEFLPFNGGPRICIGQQFALTEAGYVIVRMLQKFDKIENLDTVPQSDALHQYSLTTAPWSVPLKLREAKV